MSHNSGEEEQVENGTNNKVHFVYLCTCGAVSHFVIFMRLGVNSLLCIVLSLAGCGE